MCLSFDDPSSTAKKSAADQEQKLRALESKAKFSRNEYLLELAAANAHYAKFRDEQCPEVLDVSRKPALLSLSSASCSASSIYAVVSCPLVLTTSLPDHLLLNGKVVAADANQCVQGLCPAHLARRANVRSAHALRQDGIG